MNRILALLTMLLATACATPPSPSDILGSLPGAYVTPTPPIDPELSPFLVNVMLNDQGPFLMMVDTGSSRTALFDSAAQELGISMSAETTVLVRGLDSIVERPVFKGIDLDLGPFRFDDIDLVGLPDRVPPNFQGIIGADVLRDLVMVYDADKQAMIFIRNEDVPANTFRRWGEAELIPPPSGNETYGLAFVEASIGTRRVTALIDSGSALSVSNWDTALFSIQVRILRNQLRRQWQLDGANGPFRPRALVTLETLRIGTFVWQDPQFLLSDLTTLDILGADTEPFMIIGVDLLANQSFAFDLAGERMWFEPSGALRSGNGLTTVYVPLGAR
ncbi:MAG: retroviral-like aspartic protease family protein [Pseudomonadota bacterium]